MEAPVYKGHLFTVANVLCFPWGDRNRQFRLNFVLNIVIITFCVVTGCLATITKHVGVNNHDVGCTALQMDLFLKILDQ